MNYQSLFDETGICQGGHFRCSFHRTPGEIDLENSGHYLMLFALQGNVTLYFSFQQQQLAAGQLIAIDRENLGSCFCTESTVLLEYTVPKRLAHYFGHNSQALSTPFSTTVPISPSLQEWIDDLLTHLLGGGYTEEAEHAQRQKLAAILMKYPPCILGDLFVPFFACARGDCEVCRE